MRPSSWSAIWRLQPPFGGRATASRLLETARAKASDGKNVGAPTAFTPPENWVGTAPRAAFSDPRQRAETQPQHSRQYISVQ